MDLPFASISFAMECVMWKKSRKYHSLRFATFSWRDVVPVKNPMFLHTWTKYDLEMRGRCLGKCP